MDFGENMAKLLRPREEVKKAIAARIRAGKDLTAKAEIAESTGGYEDWLFIFAKWRDETAAELMTLYEARDIGREFTAVTMTGEYSSPRFTFPYRKRGTRIRALLAEQSNWEAGTCGWGIPRCHRYREFTSRDLREMSSPL